MYLTPVRAQSEKHTKVYMHLGIVLTANVSVLIVVSVTVPTEFTHYILHYKTHKCQISSEPNNALWTSWSQSVSGTHPYPLPLARTLQLTTTRDHFWRCYDWGPWTQNLSKQQIFTKKCRAAPPCSFTHSRCPGPSVILFSPRRPGQESQPTPAPA